MRIFHHHVHIKILEGYPVVRVGPLEDGLENDEVVPRDEPALVGVRDAEERRELRAPDFREVRARRDRADELLAVEEPARPSHPPARARK